MPAPRQQGQTLVAYLNSQAPKLAVNHALGLPKYYHSVDLLQSQAAAYRAAKNEEQLYVMLLRLAQLVIETIPKHKQCIKASVQHQRYEKLAQSAINELEQLKVVLNTRDIKNPRAYTLRRPAESVQITDTNSIPDIDWSGAAAPPAAAAVAAAAAAAPSAPPGSLELGLDLEWPPRAASASLASAAASSASPAAAGTAAAAAGSSGAGMPDWQPVTYSSSYSASQQMLQKHALFGPKGGSGTRALQPQGSSGSSGGRARYPAFDSSPIDNLWAANTAATNGTAQQQQQPQPPGGLPDVGSLSLSQQQQLQQAGPLLHPAAAAAAMYPGPSAGPSLGPQEVDVQSMLPCSGQPGGTCALPPPPAWDQQQQQQLVPLPPLGAPAVAEAAAAAAAGPKRLSKRLDLRDVHISVALMNDFLHYAASNTRRGIESCGILAGRLSAADSRFTVTTLIVPKQKGTSDTVEMLSEEEVWEIESSRELMPMGWIHTHPTQTCFLSSVDIHTQCGYQTMLDEAVAIVMAPTDSSKKCGIFRLTTPAGLEHVQRCALRGFHAACNSEQYELCGHVYLNPGAKHEVIDLR